MGSTGSAGERIRAAFEIPPGAPRPPAQLWVVIGLLGAVGALSVGWTLYAVTQTWGLFGLGHVGLVLGLFILVILAIPFCFGAGCLYLARRLQAGDRVARVLAVVLCTSAAAAFVLTGSRDLALVLAAIGCLGIVVLLLVDPATKGHFVGPHAIHGAEPAPVVAVRTLLVIGGCGNLLIGVMFLPLAEVSGILALYGLLMVGIAILVFWLSRRLSQGDAAARVFVTGLYLAYVVIGVLAGHGQPGVIIPIGIALSVIGLLWLPSTSRSYFAALPRPVSPAVAAVERTIESMVVGMGGSQRVSPGGPPPVLTAPPPPFPAPVPDLEISGCVVFPPVAGGPEPVLQEGPPSSPASYPPALPALSESSPAGPGMAQGAPTSKPWRPVGEIAPPLPAAAVAPPAWERRDTQGFGTMPPLFEPPVRRGWGSRPAGVVTLVGALVLLLDMFVPPSYRISTSSKPTWQLSYVHLDYLSIKLGGQFHHYPAFIWWSSIAVAAAGLTVILALVGVFGGGRRSAIATLLSAVASGGAAVMAVESGAYHPGMGIGSWGAVAAVAAVILAVIGQLWAAEQSGRNVSITFSVLAGLGAAAIAIAALPVMSSSQPSTVNSGYTEAPGSSPLTYSDTTTTTAPTQQAGQLVHDYTFQETEAGGYTFSGSLSLGDPEPFQNGVREGSLTAGSACSINSGTDAVIPGQLEVENTTQQFSAHAAVELRWSSNAIGGIEVGYSDGPNCSGSGSSGIDSLGFVSNDSLSSGQQIQADLFIVIPNYYSPNSPDGDRAMLAGADLRLTEDVDSQDNVDITPVSVSGPGASGLEIPLDPSAPTGQVFHITQDGTGVYDSATSGNQVGTLNQGDNVSVICTTQGDSIDNDTLWDRVTSPAGYVNDNFVSTDAGQGIPGC